MAKSSTDVRGHARAHSPRRSYTVWQDDLHFDFNPRDYLKPSLEFLDSTLRMHWDAKPSKDDLEWYKQQVDSIFHRFLTEDK